MTLRPQLFTKKVYFNTFNIFVSSYLIKDTVYYINDTKICFVIVITGGIT